MELLFEKHLLIWTGAVFPVKSKQGFDVFLILSPKAATYSPEPVSHVWQDQVLHCFPQQKLGVQYDKAQADMGS